ncbi:hypothetical protein QVD17_15801 [Tagetes erecta]|uniref:Uncharacterized protein n=1 Tax=Tagetes erecta TaxID=13708 RepID=A0AAD8KT20_TARER|nr:hypothetical protein QVD17_15801 [Tagetes erecta]
MTKTADHIIFHLSPSLYSDTIITFTFTKKKKKKKHWSLCTSLSNKLLSSNPEQIFFFNGEKHHLKLYQNLYPLQI